MLYFKVERRYIVRGCGVKKQRNSITGSRQFIQEKEKWVYIASQNRKKH